jgi:hypothetical protein
MALLDAPDFFGHTLFCDDIRNELDGKNSFIGVYGTQMLIHADFPVTLPKFAFGISFTQKRKVFDANLGIRIFLPGDAEDSPSVVADMTGPSSEDVQATGFSNLITSPTDHAAITLHGNIILAPLTIKTPGLIKVRIARRGDLIRVGALEVAPFVSQEAPAAA